MASGNGGRSLSVDVLRTPQDQPLGEIKRLRPPSLFNALFDRALPRFRPARDQ
jgi:hypothetical protein